MQTQLGRVPMAFGMRPEILVLHLRRLPHFPVWPSGRIGPYQRSSATGDAAIVLVAGLVSARWRAEFKPSVCRGIAALLRGTLSHLQGGCSMRTGSVALVGALATVAVVGAAPGVALAGTTGRGAHNVPRGGQR